jgi:hypothetical protein
MMVPIGAEGALRQKLPPDMPGRDIIADVGYSVGFLVVILGRMQLFMEQTIVMPPAIPDQNSDPMGRLSPADCAVRFLARALPVQCDEAARMSLSPRSAGRP